MAISFRTATSVTVQASTASITIPGAVQVGDVMLIHLMVSDTGGTPATPTGWTLMPGTGAGNLTVGGSWQSQLIYKVATSGDIGATVSWVVGAALPKASITFTCYAGVDNAAPIDASSFVQGTASTTHATPSITVVAANAWMVSFCGDKGSPSSTSLTVGGGFVTRASVYGTGGGSSSVNVADSNTTVSTGAQTAGTWTATLSTANSVVASVSLKPAAVGVTPGTVKWYHRVPAIALSGGINYTTDTWKATLHTSTYAVNLDTHDFYNDLTNELPTALGYTAGGKTLTTVAMTQDTANDREIITCDPISWTVSSGTLTARYCVIRKDTGVSSTSPVLLYIDFGADVNATVSLTIYNDPVTGLSVVNTP